MRKLLCLGMWITFLLFVALGYSLGADCGAGTGCADRQVSTSAAIVPETANSETVTPSTHELDRNECNGQPTVSANQALAANQRGESSLLVPALVLTLTDSAPRVSLCPGVVEIHR